uniref:Uncharacterized protein n=1 Tax=Caenorhabditis japonica TaxID=281687 RepID=A0A8R1IFY4_CAEJA
MVIPRQMMYIAVSPRTVFADLKKVEQCHLKSDRKKRRQFDFKLKIKFNPLNTTTSSDVHIYICINASVEME